MIDIVECSVGEMQKLDKSIPFQYKVEYISKLMSVGFTVLDCGNFTKKTVEVISKIDKNLSETKIAVFVDNLIIARQIAEQANIDIINFLFLNTSEEEFRKIQLVSEIVRKEGKIFNIYFMPSFDNLYERNNLNSYIIRFERIGISNIYIFIDDMMTTQGISLLFEEITKKFPNIYFGVRFDIKCSGILEKLEVVYQYGCQKFDTTIKGIGGHLPTEKLINFILKNKIPHSMNLLDFESAWNRSKAIFE